MFIHAYEAMHVFYVTFFVIVAIWFALRASDTGAWKWWAGSIFACVAAQFPFGMGLGSFAAVLTVAILRRCRRFPVLLIVLSALATFVVYYIVLPGADGVRQMTSGLSVQPVIFFVVARVGAVFAELLPPIRSRSGIASRCRGVHGRHRDCVRVGLDDPAVEAPSAVRRLRALRPWPICLWPGDERVDRGCQDDIFLRVPGGAVRRSLLVLVGCKRGLD